MGQKRPHWARNSELGFTILELESKRKEGNRGQEREDERHSRFTPRAAARAS
jgi:hypothetical protein